MLGCRNPSSQSCQGEGPIKTLVADFDQHLTKVCGLSVATRFYRCQDDPITRPFELVTNIARTVKDLALPTGITKRFCRYLCKERAQRLRCQPHLARLPRSVSLHHERPRSIRYQSRVQTDQLHPGGRQLWPALEWRIRGAQPAKGVVCQQLQLGICNRRVDQLLSFFSRVDFRILSPLNRILFNSGERVAGAAAFLCYTSLKEHLKITQVIVAPPGGQLCRSLLPRPSRLVFLLQPLFRDSLRHLVDPSARMIAPGVVPGL
jgi:hypothetical protein